MAEYIEKQAAIEQFKSVAEQQTLIHDLNRRRFEFKDIVEVIGRIPPADVRPVRRGRWKMDRDNVPHCTECGYVSPQRLFLQLQSLACTSKFIMSNYCPDCGSYNGTDMKGGDTDGDEKD